MAKKFGKRPQYISSGIHQGTSAAVRKSMRSDVVKSGQRLINQLIAHKAGKHTMVTIENPNKEETAKRFIKVPGKQFFRPLNTNSSKNRS